MKRYFLLLIGLLLFAANFVTAQCTIRNLKTDIVSSTPSGSQCNVVFDLTFDLQVNPGNKIIVVQAWDSINYPYYWGACNDKLKAPQSADLKNGTTGPLPFINLAFDATTSTKFTSYVPDNTVPLTSSYSLVIGPAINGFQTITLKNVSVTAPTCSGITMLTDIWSSQATGWGPHCVNCNNKYAFNYPTIFGTQGCNTVDNQNIRDYAFSVTNNNTNQTISYRYSIYRDSLVPQTDPNFGVYDPSDILILSSTIDSVLAPGTKDTFPPSLYINNTGQFINQKIFVVVTVNGVGNSVIETCAQTACAPLPVTLKQFNARLKNSEVLLNWETADELNNQGFEIQRRLSGSNSYEKIGFVEAKAIAGLGASYSFADGNARNRGSVAYRLAQVDFDGKKTYSDIRLVNTGSGKSQMIVYPNPSKGSARVSLPVQSGKADISLEDFSGKTIQRWNGYNSNTLQLDQIRPGIYLIRVRLQETGEQMIERLIVQ
ncbi:MAG: T9SS type A sorting domain-containing protein [Bacteroidota bacterium]